jgi:hypothetical protein
VERHDAMELSLKNAAARARVSKSTLLRAVR